MTGPCMFMHMCAKFLACKCVAGEGLDCAERNKIADK